MSAIILLLVKVTAIAALGLVAAQLAGRRSAAVRHLILAATLAALGLLPLVSLLGPAWRIALPVARPRADAGAAVAVSQVAGGTQVTALVLNADAPGPALSIAKASRLRRLTPAEWALIVWAIGAAVFLLPLLAGLVEVQRLQRTAVPWRGGVWLHARLSGPVTFGTIRPVILLPLGARDWLAEDLSRALAHEEEHIRRRDWLTHCAARAVCAVYWFHPLVWMLNRRLELEAERACDDAVLRQADALAYADQLVNFAERRQAALRPPLLAMASRTDLGARVEAVLDRAQRRGRAGVAAAFGASAMALLLVGALSPLRLVARGQDAKGSAKPHFDVAELQQWSEGHEPSSYGGVRREPARVYAEYSSLHALVAFAFDLRGMPVEGLPAWSDDFRGDHYSLDARMPVTTSDADAQLMTQALLAERFKLAWHWTTRPTKVFELVVSPGGLKLKPPNPAAEPKPPEGVLTCPIGVSGCTFMGARSENMSVLAADLSGPLGQPVVDRTGLTGDYYVPFMTLILHGEISATLPSAPEELRKLTGLELRAATDPVAILVIDHVEKLQGADPGGAPLPDGAAAGQAATPRTFDAVSIRPADPNAHVVGSIIDPSRLTYPNVTLYSLVLNANSIEPWQLTGGPDWVKKDKFALEAETAAPADNAAMMLMLRQLLADKFGLKLGQAAREGDVYRLVIASGGAKLSDKPILDDGRFPKLPQLQFHMADGGVPSVIESRYNRNVTNDKGESSTTVDLALFGQQASVGELAGSLGSVLEAPVTDATGLTGKYNFVLRYADRAGSSFNSLPTLPNALKQQLGLELVKGHGTYSVYTIESAHQPAGN